MARDGSRDGLGPRAAHVAASGKVHKRRLTAQPQLGRIRVKLGHKPRELVDSSAHPLDILLGKLGKLRKRGSSSHPARQCDHL